jgi:hypothetical protein
MWRLGRAVRAQILMCIVSFILLFGTRVFLWFVGIIPPNTKSPVLKSKSMFGRAY